MKNALYNYEGNGKELPCGMCAKQYIARLLGNRGTELDLWRIRCGTDEREHVPNTVVWREGDVFLLRIHNREPVTLYSLERSPSGRIEGCREEEFQNCPFSHVILDLRGDHWLLAVEESPVWRGGVSEVRHIIEEFFHSVMFTSQDLSITVREVSVPTHFEDFLYHRLMECHDTIESFNIECSIGAGEVEASVPPGLVGRLSVWTLLQEAYNSLASLLPADTDNRSCREKMKELAAVITMCRDIPFILRVKFRDYGNYAFNESVPVRCVMDEKIINTIYNETQDAVDAGTGLVRWLDDVRQTLNNIDHERKVKGRAGIPY